MNDKSTEQRIENFNSMPILCKAIILGAAERMEEIHRRDKDIASVFYGKCHVVGVIGDIAIVETGAFDDKYPYQAAVIIDGKWKRKSSCWARVEEAMLDAIDFKYNKDLNSQFAYYASKMVGIDNDGGGE